MQNIHVLVIMLETQLVLGSFVRVVQSFEPYLFPSLFLNGVVIDMACLHV